MLIGSSVEDLLESEPVISVGKKSQVGGRLPDRLLRTVLFLVEGLLVELSRGLDWNYILSLLACKSALLRSGLCWSLCHVS